MGFLSAFLPQARRKAAAAIEKPEEVEVTELVVGKGDEVL